MHCFWTLPATCWARVAALPEVSCELLGATPLQRLRCLLVACLPDLVPADIDAILARRGEVRCDLEASELPPAVVEDVLGKSNAKD
eukprot:3235595-Alexandrium_andersonii.AAC.1